MSLIILRNSICCSNPIASNSAWINAEWAGSISITCTGNVLMIHVVIEVLTTMMLLSVEVISSYLWLTSIALTDVLHEVPIVHRISHLSLILLCTFLWVLRISESSYSSLIEHLLFLIHLTIDMRKHLMNPWVICRLEQDTMMCGIHFIYWEGSVPSSIASSLFPHSVSHEKCLIRFLSTKPMKIILIKKVYKYLYDLHSIHSLSWRLALSTSNILLVILMNKSISKRTISHSMFIHIIVFEIGHHISKSSLSCRFCSLLLYLIHLFQILFCRWI